MQVGVMMTLACAATDLVEGVPHPELEDLHHELEEARLGHSSSSAIQGRPHNEELSTQQ
jgi:hypothetical protein